MPSSIDIGSPLSTAAVSGLSTARHLSPFRKAQPQHISPFRLPTLRSLVLIYTSHGRLVFLCISYSRNKRKHSYPSSKREMIQEASANDPEAPRHKPGLASFPSMHICLDHAHSRSQPCNLVLVLVLSLSAILPFTFLPHTSILGHALPISWCIVD